MRLLAALSLAIAFSLLPRSSGQARADEAPEPRAFDPALTYRVPVGDAPARGPEDALVTIVELSDFGCPFCGRAQTTLAALERLYPGQIRMVYRHNPLDIEDASLAAEASMAAAAQGQFWPMHDLIFAVGGRVTRAQVEELALALGLDMARFRDDLDQQRHLPRIAADAEVAHGLGIYSAPAFFVNGRPIVGALPLDVFVRVVEEELARARALVASGTPRERVYETLMARAQPRGAPLDEGGADLDAGHAPTELDPAHVYRVGPGLPGHEIGPEDPLLTVVVFSDFECPYCVRLQPALQGLRRDHGADVRIVFRHMPLPFHPRAPLAAEAAVAAAAQGRFWDFHDRVLAAPHALARADLEAHARALDLDMDAFRAALDDRRHFEAVASDVAAAQALGVRGTPTMFVNGTPVVGSAPYDYLWRLIFAPKLEEARALVERGVPRAEVYDTLMRTAGRAEARDRIRFAGIEGAVELDHDDRQAALLHACRTRDASRARALYENMDRADDAAEVLLQCRPYGVDLRRSAPADPE